MKRIVFFSAALILTGFVALTGCFQAAGRGGDGFAANRQISVVSREDGSGTRTAFVEITGVQVTADGSTRDMTTIDAEIAPSTSAVITTVAGNPYAIGYISLGSLGDTVRALSVDGVVPTVANVQNGAYSLFRTFYLAVPFETNEIVDEFLRFVLSSEGQEIAERGYVPADSSAEPFTPGSSELSGSLVISGSTSVLRLMGWLEEAFEDIHPGVNVEVHAGGTTAGINAAISGTADIGMSSRELRPTELESLNGVSIAHDGLAVIVNNENPLADLTISEIRDIFKGDIVRWDEVIE